MGLKAKLAELLSGMPDDDDEPETAAVDPDENPEPTGEGEDPNTEADPDENPNPAEGDNPGASGGAEDPEPQPTLGEPQSGYSDDERDAMNDLAAENESLRNENAMLRERIAELGGDTALGITEEVVETAPADEPGDEYDPEADIAAQEAELKRLRGDSDDENE